MCTGDPANVCGNGSAMARCQTPGRSPHAGEFFGEVPATATPLIVVTPVCLAKEDRHAVREMVFGHHARPRSRTQRANDPTRPPPPPWPSRTPCRSLSRLITHATNDAPRPCYSATPTCRNFVPPNGHRTTQLAEPSPVKWQIFWRAVRDGEIAFVHDRIGRLDAGRHPPGHSPSGTRRAQVGMPSAPGQREEDRSRGPPVLLRHGKTHLRRAASPAGAHVLRLGLAFLHERGQLRNDGVQVPDDAEVAEVENRGAAVLVDRDDRL